MFAPIKIAIRADSGPAIGTGHFARVAAVADILLSRDDLEIALVTQEEGIELAAEYFPDDTRIISIDPDDLGPDGAMRALAAQEWTPDVIILDQYGWLAEWELLAAGRNIPLLIFDDFDLARRADIMVRPHGGPKSQGKAISLRGPAYLPLSRFVAALAKKEAPDAQERLKLNICFGGSDPTGETAKALQAAAGLEELDVDVVIGPSARIDPTLIDAAEQMRHVTLHSAPNQEELAELIFEADLALGAGGVMLWERLCLRVPSLVIAIAENQQAQIDMMVARGAIRFLGNHEQVTPEKITQAIKQLASDETRRQAMVKIGQELVDGRGAMRLASWTYAATLSNRDITSNDAVNLFNWRTDDRNWEHNFESTEKPELEDHLAWVSRKLADPNCVFQLVMRGSEPLGVVRFDIDVRAASAYLSIYLVPKWHGRKMGLPVYLAAERALRLSHPDIKKIISRVHNTNKASERLHRDAGFKISVSQDQRDWLDTSKHLD
ncbi:MAG: bifunctional UDP-2,4-diacetamido-2,4,6-trideoxy-beta-L-altropyranose hydrolase/GNAT family N-acetyltransferase [Parasphingorhabdus sp.]|uniref:bifunctional UDP-2,4-diacetamido-2,4,6-trideoxy-beta-L-altropyranose hydrolase/GNAT family N-acetyltransferase n=1 Tax=Parasphingorhabdus sp. TaxID=2709688 RepID=UPI0032975583